MRYTDEIKQPLHYIRKNRKTEAIIYLKENDRKAAQLLFCKAYAMDCGYEVLGETTNLEEVRNCDVMLIATPSMITRDKKEFAKIMKQLKKKGIRIEEAINDGKAEKYINLALELYRKGKI